MLLKCIFIYLLQKISFVYSCFCSTICSFGSNSHSVYGTFLYEWGSRSNRSSALRVRIQEQQEFCSTSEDPEATEVLPVTSYACHAQSGVAVTVFKRHILSIGGRDRHLKLPW